MKDKCLILIELAFKFVGEHHFLGKRCPQSSVGDWIFSISKWGSVEVILETYFDTTEIKN